MTDLRLLAELPDDLAAAVRNLLDRAFGGEFTDDDWSHALGGLHAVLVDGDEVLAHAALVPRELRIDGTWRHCGYLEAVATDPEHRGRGLGSQVVEALGDVIRDRDHLGALSTDAHHFYERLGWEPWEGSTWVLDGGGLHRTADEDDGIMVLRTSRSTDLDAGGELACQARRGDAW